MRRILTIVFFIFSLCANAQVTNDYFREGDYSASAEAGLNIDVASSTISNSFINTFLWEDHIDDKSKQRMFNSLQKTNVAGFDLDDKLTFITFPDTFAGTTNMGVFVSYGTHLHLDLDMTRDMIKLFFAGNKQFKGKTADIGNSSLNLINYQQLQFGVISRFGEGKTHHSFGVGVSINNGIQNTRIRFSKGNLYTAPDAEYIDIHAAFDVNRSDTSDNKKFKGFGSSLNLYYSFNTENKNIFNFSISDLGFIQWNKNSQQFSKDTAMHFDGVHIDDPLNIEGNIFGNANPDSIVHSYTYADTTFSYFMLTPACFKVSYLHNFNEILSFEGSVTKKMHIHYDPLFMLRANLKTCKNSMISLSIHYGGYSGSNPLKSHNVNFGIEIAHLFGKSFMFIAGTNYLNGFINPATQNAQGAYVSLKKYFS